ncbi:MAG: class C sortase [Lachnospiraceae bacterium]|nr:class C sortase [Lachnospiraceae bacterium]
MGIKMKTVDVKSERKRRWVKGLFAILLMLAGVCLLAYPWLSNWLYDHQTYSEYNVYSAEVEDLEAEERAAILEEAQAYNSIVWERQVTMTNPFHIPTLMELGDEIYLDILSVGDSGVMGYLEIPAISVSLPIYHGTEDETLSAGVGHMEGSSLPVGGESTHAVLTGHSGLTGKKLFTDLTELEEGDYFYIRILGEILAYRVATVQTVLPTEMDTLRIQDGKDLVTLMTCTPYGVNSHRLLVTGERVEYDEAAYEALEGEKTTAISSQWLRDYRNAALTAVALLLVLLIFSGILKVPKKVKGNTRKNRHPDI